MVGRVGAGAAAAGHQQRRVGRVGVVQHHEAVIVVVPKVVPADVRLLFGVQGVIQDAQLRSQPRSAICAGVHNSGTEIREHRPVGSS